MQSDTGLKKMVRLCLPCFLRGCKFRTIVGAVLFFVVSISCVVPSASFSAEVVDRIVAVVNDELISYTMLNEAFKPYEKRILEQNYSFSQEMTMRFEFRERVINQMVDEKLTEQEVRRLGIKIGSDEVDAAIEQTKSMNSLTDEQLRKSLAEEGLTMAAYKKNMRNQLLRTRLIQYEVKSKIIVTQEDIESYYNTNKSEFGDKPLEEVTDGVREKVYQSQAEKKFKTWLTDLRGKAHVKIIQ